MGTRRKHIVSKNLANLQGIICEKLYEKSISSVYDYGGKVKMPNTYCEPCEADTPTIVTREFDTCALCGTSKEIHESY